MKKIIGLLMLISITHNIYGQDKTTDSLKQLLSKENNDSARVYLLEDICQGYIYSRPDTALLMAREGLNLSRQIKFLDGERGCLLVIGNAFLKIGNFSKALEAFLDALKIAENLNDNLAISIAYENIGTVYVYEKDYGQALSYYLKSKTIFEELKKKGRLLYALLDIGDSYEKLNKLDSADIYTNQAYALAVKLSDIEIQGATLNNLGNINAKMGKAKEAMEYYRKGIIDLTAVGDFETICESTLGMAKIFRKSGEVDSSIHYAKVSLATAIQGGFTLPALNASSFLTDYYKAIQNIDSAFAYQQITLAAKDSLFSQEKIKELQNLSFSEKIRQEDLETAKHQYKALVEKYILLGALISILIIAIILGRNNWHKQKANVVLENQKQEIDKQKIKAELALIDLKATQSQLVQREKMASLGELTAGIAHEIQNPLNFINNFSEVSVELVTELKDELGKSSLSANEKNNLEMIAEDLVQNQEKINHHGKRADAIVKGMLQHSRSSTGAKEPTDINKLADEYLRLSYQGLRAKDKSFNATIKTIFDNTIEKINIMPQDFGRVLLNLYNNAFYAVNEKLKAESSKINAVYEPTISVSTKKVDNKITITVSDNGNGIPQKAVDKIFQPFFTTKPTGQGIGLGLSLSYDIIKAHGGEIKVDTKEGEGTTFIIQLPIV